MNPAVEFKKAAIKKAAIKNGWEFRGENPNKGVFSFFSEKDKCFLDIWYRSMKAVTCMNHPKAGNSILLRENLGILDVENIFANPRHHTKKGRRLDEKKV